VASEKVADVDNAHTNGVNDAEEAGTQEDCKGPIMAGCWIIRGA